MRRKWIVALGLAALLGAATSCGDEDPTEVGSPLIGDGARTFEVVLDASEFLAQDTTYDRIGSLIDAQFRMIAHEFEGELEGHTLFRITLPSTVTYQDTSGTAVTDSTPSFQDARITLVFDTLASTARGVEVQVLPVTEDWDRGSTTWTTRIDTADVSEPWTQPGGTTGAVAGSAQWAEGDTLVIEIDSAAAAIWTDTLAAERGALLRTTSEGSRLFIQSIGIEFDVNPTEPVDSAVVAGSVGQSSVIASPDHDAPADSVLRVGGLPAWRSLLRFQPLSALTIDCTPAVDSPCTVALADVDLNLATLVLTPQPVGAFRVERPVWLESRAVLSAPGIPIVRSPLSGALGLTTDSLTTDLFTGPAGDARVEIPVTNYVDRLVNPQEDEDPPLWLALTMVGERSTFGYTSFLAASSASPPRLRLVVTATESVLQQ